MRIITCIIHLKDISVWVSYCHSWERQFGPGLLPFETNNLWLWTLIAIGYPNSHLHTSGIHWSIDGYVDSALVIRLQTGNSECWINKVLFTLKLLQEWVPHKGTVIQKWKELWASEEEHKRHLRGGTVGPPGCCTVLAQWYDGKGHSRDRVTKDIAIKDGSQECLSMWPGKGEKGGNQ